MGDPPQDPKGDAKPVAAATPATAAPLSPTPAAPPSFVGQNLKSAKSAASKAGYDATSHDASDKSAGQWDDDNWKVCFQTVTAAKAGRTPSLDFGVVRVEWPCPAHDGEPIPYPKMPAVVGQTFAKASETLGPLQLKAVEASSAYLDVTLPAGVGDWTVCFQDPKEGKELEYPKTVTAHLKVTAPGTACPATEFTRLHPDPTPLGRDRRRLHQRLVLVRWLFLERRLLLGRLGQCLLRELRSGPGRRQGTPPPGDPGYSRKLDRDGDGTACE
ncbi:excalibur calcium-binding domain-containing protein [Kitasatospora arboriphila]